jgi:hypothetical protein
VKLEAMRESIDRINNFEKNIHEKIEKLIFLIFENNIRNSLYICNIGNTVFFRSVVFKK